MKKSKKYKQAWMCLSRKDNIMFCKNCGEEVTDSGDKNRGDK